MHKTIAFLIVASIAALVPASHAAPGSAGKDSDLKRLQGDWVAKIQTDDGEKKVTVTIKGKKLRFDGPEGREWYEGTFEIDPKAKPKRISVLIEDCPIDKYKKQTSEGIYTLEDETLTICATEPGAPEGPSGFDDEKARTLTFKKK